MRFRKNTILHLYITKNVIIVSLKNIIINTRVNLYFITVYPPNWSREIMVSQTKTNPYNVRRRILELKEKMNLP